nr:RHS repeat-associated core domain-containing protein [Leisingera methylohalidivorans]
MAGGGSSRALGYDNAGNVISDNLGGSQYTYTYNAANRMSSFSVGGLLEAEYGYNALGQQVIRRLTAEGKTLHVIHDADGNRIAEYEYDPVSQSSTLLREYVWLEGEPVAVVENDQIYYIRTDHIGRPAFATDSAGVKVWEAYYLPFGGVHVSTGANSDLRFPGQWFQSETGLHQNWMRDYDPTTGRYMQADPLGLIDGPSVYGYALQNPGRYIDPRGEQAGVFNGDGTVSLPGDAGGGSSGLGSLGSLGAKLGGRLAGGVLGGILSPTTPGNGEYTPSLDQVAQENGWCGDPCEYLENKVNELKTRSESLGSCKGGMSRAQLRDRYNVFRKLAFKRQERDQICHGASDAGHMTAVTKALNRMRKCKRLLGNGF